MSTDGGYRLGTSKQILINNIGKIDHAGLIREFLNPKYMLIWKIFRK
jgi:hypothetical protein